uniref:Uncharacterized protein n=1 Tax=Anguilla anguilla TaxID=7936 RepID=A0A0E9U813_ANGAN
MTIHHLKEEKKNYFNLAGNCGKWWLSFVVLPRMHFWTFLHPLSTVATLHAFRVFRTEWDAKAALILSLT